MGEELGASAVGILVALIMVIMLVVGIERYTSGREARARRDAEHGESAGAGMFGELVEIFQPSRTHVTEEKERQRLDIVQRPAEGRPFDVDLDAGVFYVPTAEPPADERPSARG